MKKTISILLVILFLLSGCTKQEQELQKFSKTNYLAGFNTQFTLLAYTYTKEDFEEYFDYATNRFYELHQMFDIYNEYEGVVNIKTINNQAGKEEYALIIDGVIVGGVDTIPDELNELLNIGQELYELTNYELNIAMGSVLKVWHDYRDQANNNPDNPGTGPIPTMDELLAAANNISFDEIYLNSDDSNVFINNEQISFDIGGIAKGYAAEIIAQELMDMGLEYGIIDAGGNNRIINTKPDDIPFNASIRNPNGGTLPFIIKMPPNYSLVSSGDYNNFFIGEDGKSYHHIIDPTTLMPADNFREVSVVTGNGLWADALSTALFTMSYEEGYELYQEINENYFPLDVIWIIDEDQAFDHPNGIYMNDLYMILTDGLKDLTFYVADGKPLY